MKSIFTLVLINVSILLLAQDIPFPNHTIYETHIKPNNYTQTELDSHTSDFYEQWKAVFLKNDCNASEYYIYTSNGAINVSEAQGYGMMITAIMAGYDTSAQAFFNGLYNFYKSHSSSINENLMDWQQVACNDTPSNDDDAASDGDIDIAYGLLLANIQWGSFGAINYLNEAQTIINAIMQDEINQETWTVKLGDWPDNSNIDYYYGTRTSDFITDHFRSFACFTDNNNWNKVVDSCYSIINKMQINYSPNTGLLPDFIINVNTNPEPAPPDYLEDNTDGKYYYNACRDPWRLACDYLVNGEINAYNSVNKINYWLKNATSLNVGNISNGYSLNGTAMYSWNDATFLGPFTVGAMLDTNQNWINNLYEELLNGNNISNGSYYSNTLKLLSMIVISGNYWAPDCNISENQILKTQNKIHIYQDITNNIIHINLTSNNENLKYSIIDINGKTKNEGIILNSFNSINIALYSSGMYFVSVIIGDDVITKKIIKL